MESSCDDTCGCTTDDTTAGNHPVVAGRRPDHEDHSVIACTLSAHEVGEQLARWNATVAYAIGRDPIERGTRLTFERDVDIAGIATLVAAEQDCCRFLTFTLTVGADGVLLEIVGPADAQPVIEALCCCERELRRL